MKLVISTDEGGIVNVDVDANELVENLKAIVEVETSIPLQQQALYFNGLLLSNNMTLLGASVKENDLLFVQRQQPSFVTNPMSNPSAFADYIRNSPDLLRQISTNNAPLADAIRNNNIPMLVSILTQIENARKQQENEKNRRIDMLNADPFSEEAQRMIAEEIRMENVNENMEAALEHNPEAFARVHMLYIDCEVNGVKVKAFVDSGAQSTIMSQGCAERCGIMRLVDKRYAGIAKGVGTAKIIGRVHVAPIKLGQSFFPCAFTILENQGVEFLLGLDMLKKHQCSLDLRDNCLHIGEELVPFLAEKDIPKHEGFDDIPQEDELKTINQPIPSTATTTSTTAPGTNNSSTIKPTTTTGVQPQQTQQQQATNSQQFNDELISNLMGMGFSREEVIKALTLFKGDGERAAAYLFGG